ncbi:putative sister chromatid cohesion protein Pds5 [Helianthus annuus]|nr:putative sister chromatid cohesion protein Pds5 [Helianthus annuus]
MFEHFLKSVRDYHLDSVFPSMGSIMVLVIEESEEIPVEMLKPLLARVKNDNTDVLPIARNLSERVLVKSAERLKPYFLPAVTALGESLDTYTKVVTAVCKGTTATKGVLLYGPPGTGKTILAKANLKLFFIHLTVPNIIASGLAMLKNLISMPKMLADVTLGDQKKRNLLMMLLRDFVMFVQRGTNIVASWLAFARMYRNHVETESSTEDYGSRSGEETNMNTDA